jgi:hypothetical protein
MSITDWPKHEVRQAAESSGKPLEVGCAQALLAAGWNARLGSHFTGEGLDGTRELDVLAESEKQFCRDYIQALQAAAYVKLNLTQAFAPHFFI